MCTKYLNPKRLCLLLRSDISLNLHSILIFALTIFAILFLNTFITLADTARNNFHPALFAIFLVFGGLWVTMRVFRDVHTKERSHFLLTLPASNLEKFLSRLLLTTVGYTALIIAIFYLSSILILGFSSAFLKTQAIVFNPFDAEITNLIIFYLIIHAFFFLGAIYFKKHIFSKTILSLCGLLLIFPLLTSLIMFITSHAAHGVTIPQIYVNISWHLPETSLTSLYFNKLQGYIAGIVVFCCWVIAYLRLRESEI